MPLWGKTDIDASKPKMGDPATKYFVSIEEAAVPSNKAKGLSTPGWYDVVTYTDAQGKVRIKTELIVPMKVSQAAAGDGSNTVFEDLTVPDA